MTILSAEPARRRDAPGHLAMPVTQSNVAANPPANTSTVTMAGSAAF